MNDLTIISTKIRQDKEGRYCLNDCHKASGGENKNRPSIWVDNSQTKALIAEIQAKAGIPALASIRGGNAPGIWACKELVYAYAMWISPMFHLQVIRAFDAMITGKVVSATPKTRSPRKPAIDTTFRRLLNIAKLLPHVDENQQVLMAARGTFKMTGTNPLEVLDAPSLPAPNNDQYFTPTELGSKIGKSAVKMNIALADHGLQKREGKSWVMTEHGRHYGRMFDTTRRNGNGSQQQLKWKSSVLDLIA